MTLSLPLVLALAPLPLQQTLPVHAITSPPRYAGTYHVATGTWTRAGGAQALGPNVLYNNTGPALYYTAVPDHSVSPFRITDSGRVPSLSDGGWDDVYDVDGLSIGYCSSWAGGPTLACDLELVNAVAPCTRPGQPSNSIHLTGFPSSNGTQACWFLTLDLAGTTDQFALDGDADGFFDGAPALDDFGFSFAMSGHGSDTTTGPILFGDPAGSPFGDGTTGFGYGPGPDGTGLDQQDAFWIETASLSGPGCYFFGGYPANAWAGLYVQLHGWNGGTGCVCTLYCTPAQPNSVSAAGGVLSEAGGSGTSQALFDIIDVPNQPGILYTGANQIQIPFGCGERCAGGNNVRGAVIFPSGNQALGVVFDMSGPNTNIQYWYRDPANFVNCGSTFNLSNALGL